LPHHTEPEESGPEDQEVEFYWVGNEARIAGTIVHRWLHLMAAGRAATDIDALPGLRSVTRRWLQELGIADEMNTAIGARVEDALQNMLADTRGRWILIAEGRAELALTGVLDGQLETVVLDRVLIDEDGQHWIVDYKTSSHEGGNLEGFLQAESERYQPQLQKYATLYNAYADTTARCALYFPLLQTFVEL
jgi:ATP-dependent exoDNAse (exonuclease V) beta subunit